MLCQSSKLGLSVIPAQAGIRPAALHSRLRGNDGPQNQKLKSHQQAVGLASKVFRGGRTERKLERVKRRENRGALKESCRKRRSLLWAWRVIKSGDHDFLIFVTLLSSIAGRQWVVQGMTVAEMCYDLFNG